MNDADDDGNTTLTVDMLIMTSMTTKLMTLMMAIAYMMVFVTMTMRTKRAIMLYMTSTTVMLITMLRSIAMVTPLAMMTMRTTAVVMIVLTFINKARMRVIVRTMDVAMMPKSTTATTFMMTLEVMVTILMVRGEYDVDDNHGGDADKCLDHDDTYAYDDDGADRDLFHGSCDDRRYLHDGPHACDDGRDREGDYVVERGR